MQNLSRRCPMKYRSQLFRHKCYLDTITSFKVLTQIVQLYATTETKGNICLLLQHILYEMLVEWINNRTLLMGNYLLPRCRQMSSISLDTGQVIGTEICWGTMCFPSDLVEILTWIRCVCFVCTCQIARWCKLALDVQLMGGVGGGGGGGSWAYGGLLFHHSSVN